MKIELNLPKGDRQSVFLAHLNSQLESRLSSSLASARYREDGGFESTVTGTFAVGSEQVNLAWRLVKSPEGNLLFVEVESTNDTTSEINWEDAANKFVISVLTDAFTARRSKYFRRVFFHYIGPQLDGEYWFNGVRFAPVWPEDDHPHLLKTERVVSFDMNVDAIDEKDATSRADEIAKCQAARISLLLDIGLYKAVRESRWVVARTDQGPDDKSVRLQLGFFGHGTQLSELPNKGRVCPPGKYSGSINGWEAGNLISFPPETRKILRAVNESSPNIADAFDRGARLYQVALDLGNQYPSVGLAYRVASVEAISKADHECKGFSDFVRKYTTSTANLDNLLNYMYGTARSAHFHAGEFPLGEFSSKCIFDPLLDSKHIDLSHVHRKCYEIIREPIVNWIISLLPNDSKESSRP